MTIKLRICILFFGTLLHISNCLGQKIPVLLAAPASANDDQTAIRFSKSLADEIQLSGRFQLWTGKDSDLPTKGVRIMVRSVQVKLSGGNELGSAIFVEAERPSGKDPGYYQAFGQEAWMIPKDGSVADETRGFLANVDRSLEN